MSGRISNKTKGALFIAAALSGMCGCYPVVVVGPAYGPPPVYVAPPPPAYYYPPPPPQEAPAPVASDTALQQLVAPIALYPDPILADVLPASTFSDQITAANDWLQQNPQPTDDVIAAQPWDPSVQALVHYPTVLGYMADNIQWTQSLGSAVANNQPDVMAAVQDLRAQAMSYGNLQSNAEQQVLQQGGYIYIEPANPDFVFIPHYDPVLVYGGPYAVTFGPRFYAGAWLGFGFDWGHHYFYHGDWRGAWGWGPRGWGFRAGWVGPHYWVRDDARWGRPRFVAPGHYYFAHDVMARRGEWHHVEARHAMAVRNDRARGDFGGRPGERPGARPGARPDVRQQSHGGPAKPKKEDEK